MIILVTGGRNLNDMRLVFQILDGLRITRLIEGGARGADLLSRLWANARGIPVLTKKADWTKYGNAAGPIRNQLMVDMEPDQVVAFPGGNGTADCVARARKAGIPVMIVSYGPPAGSEAALRRPQS